MKDLQALRTEIDQIDQQLWEIIGKRVSIAREIGEWKRVHNMPVIQTQRFQEVLDHSRNLGELYGLSDEVVHEVMEALHKESVRVES